MAITDLRERTISFHVWIAGIVISASFLIYDIVTWNSGYIEGALNVIVYFVGISIIMVSILLNRMNLLGTGDISPIMVISCVCPVFYGMPLGLSSLIGLFIGVGLWYPLKNIMYNVVDIFHKKSIPAYAMYCHRKRKGEKFTSEHLDHFEGSAVNEKGEVTTKNGELLFVDVDKEGMLVKYNPPGAFWMSMLFGIFSGVFFIGYLFSDIGHILSDTIPRYFCDILGLEKCVIVEDS